LTKNFDIICLTETHLDANICDFFRQDRNIHGGGVLVATKSFLQASSINIETYGEEMVIIKLPPNLILCCYYKANVSLINISKMNDIISSILQRYRRCRLVLIGDFNLSGIDWSAGIVRPNAHYKSSQQQFINILHKNCLTQVIEEQTHTSGNTLDIICTSDTSIIDSINVIRPGLSDHYIIVAKLLIENPLSQDVNHKNHKDILNHRKADVIKFRNYMSYACEKLSPMENVQQMWDTFSVAFKEAIEISVPKRP